MRVFQSMVLSVACFIPSVAAAADVDYQLKTDNLNAIEQPKATESLSLTFVDRSWTAPGVEQASTEIGPPPKFDFTAPNKIHIVVAGWEDGPEWLDDVAWPRTREWFHRNRDQFFGCHGFNLSSASSKVPTLDR